ncbi:MAG: M56 family metallopeptidase [Muribaculaceae bacterium]|nr:M56 family metallopeptidase [Muribaculaceae bacterium]
MAQFFAYTVYSGIFLLAVYLVFKWFMAAEKQSRLNRVVLLGIYAVSFAAYPLSGLLQHGTAQGGVLFEAAPQLVGIETARPASAPAVWPVVLLIIYLAGAVAVALWSLVVAFRIAAVIRRGRRENRGEYTLVLLPARMVAPFSWGRYVVMGVDDYALAGDVIIEHELGHLRGLHFVDMLVAQAVCVVCWYNPASWLLREELKSVHEFEADEHVLASGVEPRDYQMLLIKKAVGLRFQSLANSLNHSKLKKRITMMYNQKSGAGRRLRGFALVPALAVALAAVNNPSVASALESLREALPESSVETTPSALDEVTGVAYAPSADSNGEVTKKDAPVKELPQVEKPAEFPGGEFALYKFLADNIVYPEQAAKAGAQGRVVLNFTILADGSIADINVLRSVSPELDAEAVRVAKALPRWTPGESGGKPVASSYVLPVTFRLQGDEVKDKPAQQ